MKITSMALAAILLLVSCASPATRATLDTYEYACAAGDLLACQQVPTWRAISQQEASQNAAQTVAAGALLMLGAALGAAVANGGGGYRYHPHYHYWHH